MEISANENAEAYFLLAQVSFFENKADSAALYLRKVIELEPMNIAANNNLINVYLQLKLKDSAVALIQKMKVKGLKPAPELIKEAGAK